MPDATHAGRETPNRDAVCSRREKNATEGGAGRFEKPAPDARAAPPEAHESLIGRKTVEEVPLTGLSFDRRQAVDTTSTSLSGKPDPKTAGSLTKDKSFGHETSGGRT